MCMEQLEKVKSGSSVDSLIYSTEILFLTVTFVCAQINFRCKPSFREPGSRAVREVSVSCRYCRHHCCVDVLSDCSCVWLCCVSVQCCATSLGPQETSDREVSTVWEGEPPHQMFTQRIQSWTLTESRFLSNRDFNRSFLFTAKRLLPSAARGANRRWVSQCDVRIRFPTWSFSSEEKQKNKQLQMLSGQWLPVCLCFSITTRWRASCCSR